MARFRNRIVHLYRDFDNVSGKTTFEWVPEEYIVKQTFKATFMGMKIQSFEIISHDAENDTFSSLVYSSMIETPILYGYDVKGKDVIIITPNLTGEAKLTGKISKEGGYLLRRLEIQPGHGRPRDVAYGFIGTRVKLCRLQSAHQKGHGRRIYDTVRHLTQKTAMCQRFDTLDLNSEGSPHKQSDDERQCSYAETYRGSL